MSTDSPSSPSSDPFAKTRKALYALIEEVSSERALGLELVDLEALIDVKAAELCEKLCQEHFELRRNDKDSGG